MFKFNRKLDLRTFLIQGDRSMTAMCSLSTEPEKSREATELIGVLDPLEWRHVHDPRPEKRLGTTFVIYPRLLSKLELVLTTTNVGHDPEAEI
jgi:hypothetical protein